MRTAKAAKRIAKRARTIAYSARTAATAAEASADGAVKTADEAKGTANQAKVTADATAAELAGLRARTDTDAGTVTTAEENAYVSLGGPTVTVTAPASGLIEVWAQATITDGAVSLYEDGQRVPDQDPSDFCSQGGPPPAGVLLAAIGGPPALALSTPGNFGLIGCGSTSAPAPVLFDTSPGEHTYQLRYADCGCDPADAEFSERTLAVAPRP